MRYQKDLEPAVREVSFEVQPGEKVAVVGRTGSGKSTLLQVLLKFRKCTEGRVRIDGTDLENVNATSLREKLSVVL